MDTSLCKVLNIRKYAFVAHLNEVGMMQLLGHMIDEGGNTPLKGLYLLFFKIMENRVTFIPCL